MFEHRVQDDQQFAHAGRQRMTIDVATPWTVGDEAHDADYHYLREDYRVVKRREGDALS